MIQVCHEPLRHDRLAEISPKSKSVLEPMLQQVPILEGGVRPSKSRKTPASGGSRVGPRAVAERLLEFVLTQAGLSSVEVSFLKIEF